MMTPARRPRLRRSQPRQQGSGRRPPHGVPVHLISLQPVASCPSHRSLWLWLHTQRNSRSTTSRQWLRPDAMEKASARGRQVICTAHCRQALVLHVLSKTACDSTSAGRFGDLLIPSRRTLSSIAFCAMPTRTALKTASRLCPDCSCGGD